MDVVREYSTIDLRSLAVFWDKNKQSICTLFLDFSGILAFWQAATRFGIVTATFTSVFNRIRYACQLNTLCRRTDFEVLLVKNGLP